LRDGDLLLWEPNAICHYLADRVGDTSLFPADPKVRAASRAGPFGKQEHGRKMGEGGEILWSEGRMIGRLISCRPYRECHLPHGSASPRFIAGAGYSTGTMDQEETFLEIGLRRRREAGSLELRRHAGR